MTDLPEKIWVFPCAGCTMLAAETEQMNPDAVSYIREDVALAMVAAHGERCRNVVWPRPLNPPRKPTSDDGPEYRIAYDAALLAFRDAQEIRALTPADAKAALDRLVAEAVGKAYDRALQTIADLPTGRTEDVMEGQEQAYRAIEAIRRGDDGP